MTNVPNYPSNPQVFPFFVCHEDGRDCFKFESETACSNIVITPNGQTIEHYSGDEASEQLELFLCGDMQEEGYELCSEIQWEYLLKFYTMRKNNQKAA